MRIAVIGTGITGSAAAWLLNQAHEITVYEQHPAPGGHANTVDAPRRDASGTIPVDTGFIVYNTATYPNLCALFEHLGVPTMPTAMSFSVSLDGGRLEYASDIPTGLLAQPANLLRPGFHRMLRDILRFFREAPRLLDDPARRPLTLGDYLAAEGYHPHFIHRYLLPMGAAIWSSSSAEILAFPAQGFIRFFHNHGLLKLRDRPQWRTVRGGSRRYVELLTAPWRERLRLGRPVTALRRTPFTVVVQDALGEEQEFDHVVVATHADMALALLADPSPEEAAILGRIRFQANRAVLHRDPSLMPRRRRAWASWNYLGEAGRPRAGRVAVTYWMNRLQSLDPAEPLFVTLNPLHAPRPELKITEVIYDHPLLNAEALAAQRRIGRIQGVRRTWYAGAWCGWGFHEDGLAAGLAVAETLGGVRRPWTVVECSPAAAHVQPHARQDMLPVDA